ncbi:MAG: hypothetical protein KBD52_02635 [Candidatus Pacebacteria bacterium]|nr:hypothetical protein [Candidatus Paceibacterota bacterium]
MEQKIRKVVRHLRSKSEEERRHILNLFMFFIIVFMFVLWIFSLGQTLSDPEAKVKIKKDLQPFSILKSNLVDGFNSTTGDVVPENQ